MGGGRGGGREEDRRGKKEDKVDLIDSLLATCCTVSNKFQIQ